jgi:type VI secretion system protein ImpL
VPVHRAFQSKLSGRYPCTPGGPDASLEDFESFFSPSGIFWTFYRENLANVVSEDGQQMFDSGVPLSNEFRGALRRAYRIRGALFRAGDQAGFTLSLRPGNPRRDPATGIISRETRLEIGGEPLVWQIGVQTWHEVSWPGPNQAQGASLDFRASNATATPLRAEGIWGFFRLLNEAEIGPVSGDQGSLEWAIQTNLGEVRVPYEVRQLSAVHPLRKDLLRFTCPADVRSAGP